MLHARRRVFPDVGRGATEIKRDATGRYYVLAYPASAIFVYNSDGQRIGQIPNAHSGSATIKFAVDFDLDSDGRLFVADRGANAIDIFKPGGELEAKVAVTAPMSVDALTGGEFAVVTLRSDRLVRVLDEQGRLVRRFGDVADAVSDPKLISFAAGGASADSSPNSTGYAADYIPSHSAGFAMNFGRLYSGTPGSMYFAFTSVEDPKFRKYDPFGYSAYEVTIPASALVPDAGRDDPRVQVGMRVSGMRGPGESYSLGTMYSVGGDAKFTASSGGGRGARGAGNQPGTSGPAGTNSTPGGIPGSVDTSAVNAIFTANATDGSGDPGDLTDISGLLSGGAMSGMYDASTLNAPGGIFGPGGFGGFGGGFDDHFHGGEGGEGFSGGHVGGTPGGGGGEGGHGEFGEHGGFGHGFDRGGVNTYSGVVKITERAPGTKAKPVIRAISVDTTNQNVWAAVSDLLLHFDKNGNLLDTYRVATPEGAALQPVGILVEQDRLLLVADPAGIYDFARPDKQ